MASGYLHRQDSHLLERQLASLHEGSGFELSVPISKLADDNFQATFASSDEKKIKRGRMATGTGISAARAD